MSTYCDVAPGHEWHGPYHQSHYGFPIADDDELFERLILEINQAGLSWLTILKRQDAFRKAFREFKIEKVARLGARDVERLMKDASIIRNRMKIAATIENAKRIKAIQRESGLVRRVAEVASPQAQGRMGQAVQEDLRLHRRRDRRRVPDEHRLSARRASRGLPDLQAHRQVEAGLERGREKGLPLLTLDDRGWARARRPRRIPPRAPPPAAARFFSTMLCKDDRDLVEQDQRDRQADLAEHVGRRDHRRHQPQHRQSHSAAWTRAPPRSRCRPAPARSARPAIRSTGRTRRSASSRGRYTRRPCSPSRSGERPGPPSSWKLAKNWIARGSSK